MRNSILAKKEEIYNGGDRIGRHQICAQDRFSNDMKHILLPLSAQTWCALISKDSEGAFPMPHFFKYCIMDPFLFF